MVTIRKQRCNGIRIDRIMDDNVLVGSIASNADGTIYKIDKSGHWSFCGKDYGRAFSLVMNVYRLHVRSEEFKVRLAQRACQVQKQTAMAK